MKRTILIYGICGGVLIVVLRLVEYRFLIVEYSLEIYGALVALIFALLGIWLGLKLTRKEEVVVVKEVEVPARHTFVLNEAKLEALARAKNTDWREAKPALMRHSLMVQPGLAR